MQQLSIPDNSVSPCPECQNTGRFSDEVYYLDGDIYGPKFCTCPAGETAFREWCRTVPVQQALQKKRQRNIQKTLEISQIPTRWRDKSLDNLVGQEHLKQTIQEYLHNFTKWQKQGRGIYLWSHGSGRGKTHVLTAVCRQMIEKYSCPCIFLTEDRLYLKLRATFHTPVSNDQSVLDPYLNTVCLFLDDLGATKVSAWKTEILTGIIDHRLQNALPTFFTSNYSLADYQTLIETSLNLSRPERIPSRIYEMCRGFIIEVQGGDFRKKLPT